MKNSNKMLFFGVFIVACLAFTLTAEAAKKLPQKAVKKALIHQVKTVQPIKKQTQLVKKVVSAPIPAPVVVVPVTSTAVSAYPWHDSVLATQFFIGENGVNGTTAWDCHAVSHYGGIDSPFGRIGYLPTFQPKENPFYLALPYTDIGDAGTHKKDIPWYDAKLDTGSGYSFVKNTWVAVSRNGKTCYGQWEDSLTPDILDAAGKRIGYGKPNAFDYVFGTAAPTHPGIDVSPALSDCLGMRDPNDTVFGHSDGLVSWKFVKDTEVPAGAWKNIVTATPVSWDACQ